MLKSQIPVSRGDSDVENIDSNYDNRRKYSTAYHIETFLTEGLGMTKEFSKGELQLLFLDSAGIILNENALYEIFTLVDMDKSGLVSAAELASFVHDIRPRSKSDRRTYVTQKTLTFPPFYLCLLNLAASILAATSNISEREGGPLADSTDHPYWGIAAICDLIGNFGYIVLKWEEESLALKGIQQARDRLLKWVKVDLQRFTKDISTNTNTNHSKAMSSLRYSINYSQPNDVGDKDDDLDLHEMSLLLESMGVFLPELMLREVFYEVDTDRSGTVSINEFQEYLNRSKQVVGRNWVRLRVLERCLQTIGFWAAWCFVIGACFWVTFSHAELSDDYFRQFVGMTCFFYLCGAVGNLSNVYDSTGVTFRQLNNAEILLRATAISIGKAAKENDNMSKDLQRRDRKHFLKSVAHSAMKIKKSSSLNRSKKKQEEEEEEETRKAQETGARILFEIMDISQDSNIDATELFDALTVLGILIPVHIFHQLFSRVDKSGDGNVDIGEFIQYIISIEASMSTKAQFMATLHMIIKESSFYLVLIQCSAGFLQTIAAYSLNIPSDRTRNMFLVGSCFWGIGGLYFLMRWPQK